MSARTKSIPAEQRSVTHAELLALTTHISALIAGQEVRLAECERVLAVDPEVGELAAAFLARVRGTLGERSLSLVATDPETLDNSAG